MTAAPLVTCFLSGTLIATPDGQRAVETLRPGDAVLGADGTTHTIRWMGRQTVIAVFADPLHSYPIRMSAGALGGGLPRRDLFLSPGHALFIDDLLVHAGALVNGTSITRVTQPEASFTYWHIETEGHVLVRAEGTPAETFVDNVTRRRFDNYAEYEALFGEERFGMEEMDEPRVKSARQLPEHIRARLDEVAATLGLARDLAA
jgi:hypothetical protein